MNTKYDNQFSPRGAQISYEELSVDSSIGHPHSESEGDLNGSPKISDEAVSTPPDTSPKIAPEGATPPNNYPVGDNTKEVASMSRQRRTYQQKKWIKSVWERGSDNKLKRFQLNKSNWE